MSLLEMKEYMKLCLDGPSSIPDRKKILYAKQRELENKIKEIQGSIDYINWKHKFYDDVLAGKREYYSNLIDVDEN